MRGYYYRVADKYFGTFSDGHEYGYFYTFVLVSVVRQNSAISLKSFFLLFGLGNYDRYI